jgi:asparagine synthase (glutamine-hydrolysing)
MPALNLDTTDKMSMAANLEVRVPFLNHKLVSLSERMPASLKIKGLKRKYILKRAAEKWLPKDIVWRKKAGFSAPVRSWMRNDLGGMLSELLSERAVKQRGLFNHSYISHMMEMNSSGQEDFNLQLFQLLNLEIWMREFID